MIKNRHDAGIILAQKLKKYQDTDAVIIGLPRGGVVIGDEVSRILSLPFDIFVSRKIGHPLNPEYAIGAVDDIGRTVFDTEEIKTVDWPWLKREIKKQENEAKRRMFLYYKNKKHIDVKGKSVIIVDDGIATGLTARLAIKVLQRKSPKKIIVAAPVASLESIEQIKKEGADEVILIEPAEKFIGAVGSHYKEFDQVKDDEVIEIVKAKV